MVVTGVVFYSSLPKVAEGLINPLMSSSLKLKSYRGAVAIYIFYHFLYNFARTLENLCVICNSNSKSNSNSSSSSSK